MNIPKRQKYILAACPSKEKSIAKFYDTCIEKKVRVIITANQVGESGKCPAYWKNKILKELKLSHGWSIEHDKSKKTVLATGKKGSKIVERTLVAKKGSEERKIIHMHYVKWEDRMPSPDVDLLMKLLDRKDEIQKGHDVPVAINCKAGRGRTGTIAVADLARKEIDAQLQSGTKLDKVRVNIPEMIYEMRKQRPSILGRVSQVQHVYALLGKQYARLKNKE